MKIILSVIFSLFIFAATPDKQLIKSDAILGRWETLKHNLVVEVYKDQNDYKARLVWFDDTDDKSKPMNIRMDEKNPDKTLRSRRVLGMEILHNLVYNAKDDRWEKGEIYDCTSGKTWSSSAWLTKEGLLKVRGFWHFEFIGQTLIFKRA
jgi:uncharacterized protein (DUF2147 family)